MEYKNRRMEVFFPVHFNAKRISYTCLSLAEAINNSELTARITAPSRSGRGKTPIVSPIMPDVIGQLLGRVNRNFVSALTQKEFLRRVRPGDSVYIWSEVSTEFLKELRRRDNLIFREKFNGLKAFSRETLQSVYERTGFSGADTISDEDAQHELDQMEFVDKIFVANPAQLTGYAKYGIPKDKVIQSSYGWDPERIIRPKSDSDREDAFTALYVGVINFHKGVDLLIDSWIRSGVEGRLVLAGPISTEFKHRYSSQLDRDDIIVTGWVDDIAEMYHSSDLFLFPSHDEGGPLVTYEAMGCGLPVIVSPMGAGAIARDAEDGFVIDPYDIDGWADRLRQLAADADLRMTFGRSAKNRAAEFVWQKVGAQRRAEIVDAMLKN